MPTATKPANRDDSQDPLMFIPMESAICLQCSSEIRSEHLDARLDPARSAVEPTTQTVYAWCETCQSMFRVHRRLAGGQWHIEGNVVRITSERERAQVMKRLEAKAGVIRRQS